MEPIAVIQGSDLGGKNSGGEKGPDCGHIS